MILVGMTGGSGSGKSTVASIFASCGATVIDADAVYHSLISAPSACVSALVDAFGEEILTPDGAIDRKRLADVVFDVTDNEKKKLATLNSITHRFVYEEFKRLLTQCESESLVVMDVPLLFQSGFDRLCDLTVAVLAPMELRLARITQRDGIDVQAAERRLAAQPDDEYYLTRADRVIRNEGDLDTVRAEVLALINTL